MGFITATPSQYGDGGNRQAATAGWKTTETPAGSCMPSEILLTVSPVESNLRLCVSACVCASMCVNQIDNP